MKKIGLGLLALGGCLPWLLSVRTAHALPGYSVDEVKTWMQGHPTLQASSREGLRVHRSDVPSQRYTFQASVFPVGGFQNSTSQAGRWSSSRRRDLSIVRREEFIWVDYDDEVTAERLENSLRTVYGPDLYAEYRRAQTVYQYPGDAIESVQGEVRLGDTYVYWLELIPDASGVVTIGKFNVLLPEDVDRLQTYLQRQESTRR